MSFTLRNRLNPVFREVKTYLRVRSIGYSTSVDQGKKSYFRPIAVGIGLGILVGGGYTLYNFRSLTKPAPLSSVPVTRSHGVLQSKPDVKVSRQVKIPNNSIGLEITLFQYPTCPFCCKVRAFLDYYGVPYDVVEVNPVLRQQIKWSNYKKVPILLIRVGDEYVQLNDSSMIISGLATYLKLPKTNIKEIVEYYPIVYTEKDSKKFEIVNKYFVMSGSIKEEQLQTDKEERKWRKWADDVLVHTLSPNVYRTKEEALEAFQWFSEVGEWEKLFSKWERLLVVYVGAYAMWLIGKKLKKRHNLKENVRESLYDECRYWLKEVNKKGKFAGGSSPNLADLAVYGVLSSIEGCQAFTELLQNTSLNTWYSNMKQVVQNHEGLATLR